MSLNLKNLPLLLCLCLMSQAGLAKNPVADVAEKILSVHREVVPASQGINQWLARATGFQEHTVHDLFVPYFLLETQFFLFRHIRGGLKAGDEVSLSRLFFAHRALYLCASGIRSLMSLDHERRTLEFGVALGNLVVFQWVYSPFRHRITR